MASNYLKIGQKAIDKLAEALDAWDDLWVDVSAEVPMERISYTCRPIEVCEDGVWSPGGYWPDEITTTDLPPRVHPPFETISRAGELGRVMTLLARWWTPISIGVHRREQFGGDDPCTADPGFEDRVLEEQAARDAADLAEKQRCDELKRRIGELESERRGLVGVSPELELDQRRFEREMAENRCEHEEESARHYEESAAKQDEIFRLTGLESAQEMAQSARESAAAHADAMREACEQAEDYQRRIERLEQQIERAPERIEEIDAELAGLREQAKDCP